MKRRTIACVLCLFAGPHVADVVAEPTDRGIVVEDCIVRFGEEVDVPAVEAGRLAAVDAKQNDPIRKGQLIARQDDSAAVLRRRAANWQKTAATEELQDDIDLQYANALYAEAVEQRDADKGIYQKGGGSLHLLRQSELAVERARLEIARAQKSLRLAKIQVELRSAELEAIDDQLERLKITAPIDGVILQLNHRPGEWIDEGEAVATVARMNQLKADAFLSVDGLSPRQAVGRRVTVHWKDRGTDVALEGVVDSVDPQMLTGRRYRLHATIENRQQNGFWLLLPGTEVTMRVHLASSP